MKITIKGFILVSLLLKIYLKILKKSDKINGMKKNHLKFLKLVHFLSGSLIPMPSLTISLILFPGTE